jgi:hypothetical protein
VRGMQIIKNKKRDGLGSYTIVDDIGKKRGGINQCLPSKKYVFFVDGLQIFSEEELKIIMKKIVALNKKQKMGRDLFIEM